jgi:hypothetical protein
MSELTPSNVYMMYIWRVWQAFDGCMKGANLNIGGSTLNWEFQVFGIHITAVWTQTIIFSCRTLKLKIFKSFVICILPSILKINTNYWSEHFVGIQHCLGALMFTWWTFSNQYVLIMEDFEGVGFGCCLGLRRSYLSNIFWVNLKRSPKLDGALWDKKIKLCCCSLHFYSFLLENGLFLK